MRGDAAQLLAERIPDDLAEPIAGRFAHCITHCVGNRIAHRVGNRVSLCSTERRAEHFPDRLAQPGARWRACAHPRAISTRIQ